MLTEDLPIMTWKHKNSATDISLWNSSSLPLSSNTDWNKEECRLNMFSTDGRNIKKFLIKEFVNNSSHFAGCPAINANEFWTLAVTFIYFSKSHFHSHARSPKLHRTILPAWWRFWMSPDWCSLRIWKIFFVCQLLCSFDPPICIWYITQQESFSFCFTECRCAIILWELSYSVM